MKYALVVVGVLAISATAFAGNGGSHMGGGMHGGPGGNGGCTNVRILDFSRPSPIQNHGIPSGMRVMTPEIMKELSKPTPPPPVVTTPPPVDQSVVAGQNMVQSYSTFLGIPSQNVTDTDVSNFVTQVSTTLIRYRQHIPTAKGYFTNESRAVYKILFASIIYIADQNDQDAVNYLRSMNTTQQEFADMDQIRSGLQTSGLACMIMAAHISGPSHNPYHSVIQRFINGR